MRVLAAWFLDLLVLATVATIGFVLASGGGTYDVFGVHLRLRSPDNAVTFLTVLLVVRYAAREWHPLFGLRRVTGSAIDVWFVHQVQTVAHVVRRPLPFAATLVLLMSVAACGVKAWLAASSPGFYSGDDVEIHEMTLGHLLGYGWPIWDLRSPVFPFAFVYPAQWAAQKLGVSDVGLLVVSGRLAIAAVSTLAVWLTWRIGLGVWPEHKGYALVAAALVATAKLQLAFGSTELPRPVATVLVLCGFLLTQDSSRATALFAGMVIGVAACLRFSEAIFLIPPAVQYLYRRQTAGLLCFVAAAVATMVLLLAIPDWLYWREPFHSVRTAVDFTLIQKLSSRGYQPPWWYLSSIPQWTTVPLFLLACLGAQRRPHLAVWVGVPILGLSLLPHKEPRYLIPTIPFACLLATEGLRRLADNTMNQRRAAPSAAAFCAALTLGFLGDAIHYRLPRSDADVRFGRSLAAQSSIAPLVLVEQLWRFGGHLYFGRQPVGDLDPGRISDPDYLVPLLRPGVWVVLDRRADAAAVRILTSQGLRPTAMGNVNYVVWSR